MLTPRIDPQKGDQDPIGSYPALRHGRPVISTIPDRDRDDLSGVLKRIGTASRRAARAAETIQQAYDEIAEATTEARTILTRKRQNGASAHGSTQARGRLLKWSSLSPGQRVLLRGKRTTTEVTVTVAEVLPRVLGDGLGLVADDGTTYRQYYFDVREADA